MLRNRVFTILGILCAWGAALAGFLIMMGCLDQKQEEILSQRGSAAAAWEAPEKENPETGGKRELSKEELIGILESRETDAEEFPHEPMGGQLTMKEAIGKGEQWLRDFFGGYLDGPADDREDFEKITATLCKKAGDGTAPENLYSYWTVTFANDRRQAELVLNGVTGQVLQAAVTSCGSETDFRTVDAEGILKAYAASFSLEAASPATGEESLIYLDLEPGSLYAILRKSSIVVRTSEETTEYRNTLRLYLSTILK